MFKGFTNSAGVCRLCDRPLVLHLASEKKTCEGIWSVMYKLWSGEWQALALVTDLTESFPIDQ